MSFKMTKLRVLSFPKSLTVLLLVLVAAIGAFPQEPTPWSQNNSPLPPPTGFINDYAGVIDPAAKSQLEDKLKQFKEKTGVEIAVAVVKTTGDRPIFDYSLAVARGWKIGSKEDDNPGLLLMVAIDDRKYFTQVGKDLEDELPDASVGQLQRQFLVPEFRKQNYAKGIGDTIDAYIRTVETQHAGGGTTPTPTKKNTGPTEFPFFSLFCCLAVLLVIALIIWSNRGGGGKTKGDSDRWGGGFGGGGSTLPWIILGSSSGSSWGGSSSDSSWGSGGGSDWGGFGGGGDFGGGGGGGDW
ncbi:MAG: TPM domain-containing protein [Blastocatellia bacterium]